MPFLNLFSPFISLNIYLLVKICWFAWMSGLKSYFFCQPGSVSTVVFLVHAKYLQSYQAAASICIYQCRFHNNTDGFLWTNESLFVQDFISAACCCWHCPDNLDRKNDKCLGVNVRGIMDEDGLQIGTDGGKWKDEEKQKDSGCKVGRYWSVCLDNLLIQSLW